MNGHQANHIRLECGIYSSHFLHSINSLCPPTQITLLFLPEVVFVGSLLERFWVSASFMSFILSAACWTAHIPTVSKTYLSFFVGGISVFLGSPTFWLVGSFVYYFPLLSLLSLSFYFFLFFFFTLPYPPSSPLPPPVVHSSYSLSLSTLSFRISFSPLVISHFFVVFPLHRPFDFLIRIIPFIFVAYLILFHPTHFFLDDTLH